MSKKWACRTYYNPNPFISFSWHDTIMTVPVPPFVVPTKAFHLNFSVVQGLWIGSFLSNGRGKKIVGDDLLFVGRTSDAGLFVPHISFPPTWMNILTTLFGSSMCLFGCSSVTLACKNILWGNEDCDLAATPFGPVPFSLNLACHDPYSAPTDIVVVWGSVYSGMSLGDMLAALIDFAINLACEVGMKYVAEPLAKKAGSGISAVSGKISAASKRAAAKKAARTGIKSGSKSAFSSAMSSVATSVKKLVGYEATDAMTSYTQKAATTRGMYNSLKELCYSTGKTLDNDLVDLVNAGTPGVFSKEFLSELQNINSSKYDDYVKEMLSNKQAVGLRNIGRTASENMSTEFTDLLKKSYMTENLAIDTLTRTTLWTAMKEMSDAAEKAASTELARSLGYAAIKKSISQMLWKYTIRNGNLIKVSVAGYDVDSGPDRQLADKWWANQEWFGYEIWNASDLGLTETDDSSYWEEAYVEGDGTDDDYWYVSVTDDSSSSDGDEDDDYWYGTDENADAAE